MSKDFPVSTSIIETEVSMVAVPSLDCKDDSSYSDRYNKLVQLIKCIKYNTFYLLDYHFYSARMHYIDQKSCTAKTFITQLNISFFQQMLFFLTCLVCDTIHL